MRNLFSSTGKAALLAFTIALAVLFSAILPATGSVMQKSGSPFLYDDSTGRLVGIRNSDGTDTFFPLYSTQAGATATAAFTPAAPGAIGGTTPAAASFTTLTTTGTTTLGGILTVASSVRTGTTTVGALATCGATIAGARHFVTDANTTTFMVTAAAGGANAVPVVCNGTNWVIG